MEDHPHTHTDRDPHGEPHTHGSPVKTFLLQILPAVAFLSSSGLTTQIHQTVYCYF